MGFSTPIFTNNEELGFYDCAQYAIWLKILCIAATSRIGARALILE